MVGQTPTCSSAEGVVGEVERRARRHLTPCGAGDLIWRAWGAGPPLLLLHGSHGSWAHWIRNIGDLARDRTVWTPDLPGFGDSAAPERDDLGEGLAQALATGLHKLVSPAQGGDVVGFSFGAVLGAHLAVIAPERVRRLVLVGAGGLGTPRGNVTTMRLGGLEGGARRAARRANLDAVMIHDPQNVDDLALYLQERDAPRARVNPANMVLPDKLLEILPRVHAQIDPIWGDCDSLHPNPADQRRVLSRLRPDIDFRVIPNAGHWVMYDSAQAFDSTLRHLLDQPLRDRR